MKITGIHVSAGIALLAAGGIALLATRSAGPVPLTQYTELREGPLMEHVVTEAGLLAEPVHVPHRYPQRVAPLVSAVVNHGYAPLYQPPDPQAAALPAEQAW